MASSEKFRTFAAVTEVDTSLTGGSNRSHIAYVDLMLAYNLSKVELQAKFSGQSLAEYTGCTYEEDSY